jgi:hypothetical protein
VSVNHLVFQLESWKWQLGILRGLCLNKLMSSFIIYSSTTQQRVLNNQMEYSSITSWNIFKDRQSLYFLEDWSPPKKNTK